MKLKIQNVNEFLRLLPTVTKKLKEIKSDGISTRWQQKCTQNF